MGVCFDCGKVNNDEAFSKIREAAKAEAKEKGHAVAIVWEGEWKYYNAFYAVQNNYQVKEIVSHV